MDLPGRGSRPIVEHAVCEQRLRCLPRSLVTVGRSGGNEVGGDPPAAWKMTGVSPEEVLRASRAPASMVSGPHPNDRSATTP